MANEPYSGPEIQAAIDIIKSDAQMAHQSAVLERLDRLEQRMQRMPVTEMTAEEKAAAYDKLMSQQNQPPKDPPKNDPPRGPVPPDPKPPKDPEPPRRDPFWGDRLNA